MKPRLCEYIETRRAGGHGWRESYELSLFSGPDGRMNYVAAYGWMTGLLEELLGELPEAEITRIYDRLLDEDRLLRAKMETEQYQRIKVRE